MASPGKAGHGEAWQDRAWRGRARDFMSCDAELCPNWTGQGCICGVLGLGRPEHEEEDQCCEDWDDPSHYHCYWCGGTCSFMGHGDCANST
jgi:hypothetical protein